MYKQELDKQVVKVTVQGKSYYGFIEDDAWEGRTTRFYFLSQPPHLVTGMSFDDVCDKTCHEDDDHDYVKTMLDYKDGITTVMIHENSIQACTTSELFPLLNQFAQYPPTSRKVKACHLDILHYLQMQYAK